MPARRRQRPADPHRDEVVLDAHQPGPGDRAVRGLVANAPSGVRRAQAIRVRDVNRPTPDELREAAATVEVVHRGWRPPEH